MGHILAVALRYFALSLHHASSRVSFSAFFLLIGLGVVVVVFLSVVTAHICYGFARPAPAIEDPAKLLGLFRYSPVKYLSS